MWLSVNGATSAGVRRRPLAAAASGSCIISERVHAKRRRCGVWVLDASPAKRAVESRARCTSL